jgi:hypothetical protein
MSEAPADGRNELVFEAPGVPATHLAGERDELSVSPPLSTDRERTLALVGEADRSWATFFDPSRRYVRREGRQRGSA